MLSEQQRLDGIALKRVKTDPEVWAAIERVAARMNNDLIDRFSNGDEKKSWLRGAREAVGAIIPTIEQMIQDSADAEQEDIQNQKILHGETTDGSSDLAIG